MNAHWRALDDELRQWASPAPLWWRDDDAVADTVALRQLIDIQRAAGEIPLHLAVVPAALEASLPALLDAHPRALVLQHGVAHRDNSSPEQRKIELGGVRPVADLLAELGEGHARLGTAFGAQYRPALVPPWNRIDPSLVEALAGGHWRALSVLGPAAADADPPQCNVHLDLIDWRARRFAGEARCLDTLTDTLRERRLAHSTEAIGLMSHHLDHDDALWDFLARLMPWLAEHPHVDWLDIDAAIAHARTAG